MLLRPKLPVSSVMLLAATISTVIAQSAHAEAHEVSSYYLELGLMAPPTAISPSSDLAGGYVGNPNNGALGGERYNSDKVGALIKLGYAISDKYNVEVGYLRSSYQTVDFGVTFNSGGQFNPNCCYTGSAVLSSRTYFVSVSRKFATSHSLAPYVGVGIGLSQNSFTEGAGVGGGMHSKTKDSVAIKVDFGVSYKLSPSVSWQSEFSMYDLGDYSSAPTRNAGAIDPYKFESGINKSVYSGLRFSF